MKLGKLILILQIPPKQTGLLEPLSVIASWAWCTCSLQEQEHQIHLLYPQLQADRQPSCSWAPSLKLQGASPKSILLLHNQKRFKHILWGIEIKQMGRCSSLLHPMQSHSSPLPPQPSFLCSFPTTPAPYHYLVGLCKEGSLLRELLFVFQSLLTPSLFLPNPQQVSVFIAQALGRRERKDD